MHWCPSSQQGALSTDGCITRKENDLGVFGSCPGDKTAPSWKPVVAKQQQRRGEIPGSLAAPAVSSDWWNHSTPWWRKQATSGCPDGRLWSATKYLAGGAAQVLQASREDQDSEEENRKDVTQSSGS